MDLLLGCGASRERRAQAGRDHWSRLVTLDMNPDHKPDVVHDIASLPLPFEADTFEEVHAYEVMEHVGQQGDWRFFFNQWSDIWRILQPGGMFFGTSPHWSSPWAWMDPGHTRAMGPEMLTFLRQPEYDRQIGGGSPMTDYRFIYKADFDILLSKNNNGQFQYILKAVKPSRCTKS